MSDICRRFDVIALDIDNPYRHIEVLSHLFDGFEFSKFTTRHFEVHFVDGHAIKGREHGGVLAWAHSPPLEIAEAQMGRQASFAHHRRYRAVKQIHHAGGVFFEGITAHRGLIDGQLTTPCRHQGHQFGLDDGQQGFGDGITIGVIGIG